MDKTMKLGVITANISNPDRTREAAMLEVDRELKVRFRCFDDWIAAGKLAMGEARDRMECMVKAYQILAAVHSLSDGAFEVLMHNHEARLKANMEAGSIA